MRPLSATLTPPIQSHLRGGPIGAPLSRGVLLLLRIPRGLVLLLGLGDYLHIAEADAQAIQRVTTSSLKFSSVPTRGPSGELYSEDEILHDLRAHPKWANASFVGRPRWIKAKAMASLGPVGTILVQVADVRSGANADLLRNTVVRINDHPSQVLEVDLQGFGAPVSGLLAVGSPSVQLQTSARYVRQVRGGPSHHPAHCLLPILQDWPPLPCPGLR